MVMQAMSPKSEMQMGVFWFHGNTKGHAVSRKTSLETRK